MIPLGSPSSLRSDAPPTIVARARLVDGEPAVRRVRKRILRPTGQVRWIEVTGSTMVGADGLAWTVGHMWDVTHEVEAASLLATAQRDVANLADVVRRMHSGDDVRSAIVNTADRQVIKPLTGGGVVVDANKVGTGRENLQAAFGAKVALDPVSVSFGAVPSGSGQSLTRSVTVTNLSGAVQTYLFTVTEPSGAGVVFAGPAQTLNLASGATGTVLVSMSAQRGIAAGNRQAVLQISAAGAVIANAMLYALIQ